MSTLDATDVTAAQAGALEDPNMGAYEQMLGDSAPVVGTADSGSAAPENGTTIAGSDDGFSLIDPQVSGSILEAPVEAQDARGEQPEATASPETSPGHTWKDNVGSALLGGSIGVASTGLFYHRHELGNAYGALKLSLFDRGNLSRAMTSGLTDVTAAEETGGKASKFASQVGRFALKGLKFLK